MRRRVAASKISLRPHVETMEPRALLSSDLSVSLTTDKAVYQPGQPIELTFTETNNSDHEISLSYGPSVDGFVVSEEGQPVWQSNAGANPMFIVLDKLEPGQSLTLHSTWNGVPNQQGSSPILAGGTFTVTNELDPDGPSASFQIASPLSYALSVDQAEYQVGQPIQLSFTETNTGTQPLSINVPPATFTIADDLNNVVWQSAIGSGSSTIQTLEPGQSIAQTSTWNGISNTGQSPNTNPWGTFVLSSSNAPSGLTATFSIGDPLSTSLTTQSASYLTGQPVIFTWTETNQSTVPVTIPDSPGLFTVSSFSSNSQLFSATVSATAPIVTLASGQSLSKSVTWPDNSPAAAPGRYSAYFDDGSLGGGTTFDIASPSTAGPLIATLETPQSSYVIGHPVALALTLTNAGTQPVTVSQLVKSATIQLSRGSTVLWRSRKTKLAARAALSIVPGQSIELRGVWKGSPFHANPQKLRPGIYDLEVSAGGYSAFATIRLTARSAR